MKFLRGIAEIITQVLMLLTIPAMIVSGLYIVFWGLGKYMVYFLMARIKDFKKDSYTFLSDNYSYGMEYNTHWTEKHEHNIYDKHGNKIGSYETTEEKSGVSEDIFKYQFAKRGPTVLYWFLYPLLRIISLILSVSSLFISMFTNRFYVQISCPEDYDDVKYNQFLHCWLDVVYERKITSRDVFIFERERKKEEKKQKKQERLQNRYFEPLEIVSIFIAPIVPPVFIALFLWGIFGTLVTLGNPKKIKGAIKILIIWLLSLPVAAIYFVLIYGLIKYTS